MYGYEIKEVETIFKSIGMHRPAFKCIWGLDKQIVGFTLYIGAQQISFELTIAQLENLKIFLKKTISHKSSSNEDLGFVRFDITENFATFFPYKSQMNLYVNNEEKKKQSERLKEFKRMVADVTKYKVAKLMDITVNGVKISLTRKNFYSFREAVLNPQK